MENGWLIAVSFCTVVITVVLFQSFRRNRELKELRGRYLKKIEGREQISFNDFAQKYFPECDAGVVCIILECIQDWSVVCMDRLCPSDHLAEDLSIGKRLGMEPNHLVADIADACKTKIDDSFLVDCSGELGDFIQRCCKQIA